MKWKFFRVLFYAQRELFCWEKPIPRSESAISNKINQPETKKRRCENIACKTKNQFRICCYSGCLFREYELLFLCAHAGKKVLNGVRGRVFSHQFLQ